MGFGVCGFVSFEGLFIYGTWVLGIRRCVEGPNSRFSSPVLKPEAKILNLHA